MAEPDAPPLLRLDGDHQAFRRDRGAARGELRRSTAARWWRCSATTAPASRRWSRSSPAASSRPRGRILFEGVERRFASPAEAKAAGIETVYQDLSLCTNVDVVANFFMGRELTRRVLGIPILRERDDGGGDRQGARRRRHPHPVAPRQCRASLRRPAPGDRAQPLRPLGRQARPARRALRRARRRADAARPRDGRARRARRASASSSSPTSWRRPSRSPTASW